MARKKILVIEDEKDVNENIKILFEEEGFDVVTAPSGKEGIELAKAELPDVIICDIMMREIDGYGVLKALAKSKNTKSIPFIFLTAKVDKKDIRLGMELGADDYLFKPYKSDDLIKAVNARLKRIEVLKAGQLQKTKQTEKKIAYGDKLFIKISGNPVIINSNEIIYISAENQYTLLNTVDGKSYLIRKSISGWEKYLPAKQFLRIHRSTMINLEYIVKMEKWGHSSLLVYLKGIEKPFVISKRSASKFRNNLF